MSAFRTIELSDPAISAEGLRFVTVKSAALGGRADITLYVPPEAEAAPGPLPIVLLLHGVYGSHWAWALKGAAHLTAQRLIMAGEIPPLVLAMPSDGLAGDGSGYVPHGSCDFERWIIDEVPAAVAETCPACGPASPLAIVGLSMGGFAALRLAGKYPNRIAAAAAHSTVTEAVELDALIEESRAGWSGAPEDMTVLAALERAPALPPIRFDCGRDDPFIKGNRRLSAALRTRGIAHDYAEHEGGHDWPYWRRYLEDSLRFAARALR
jgi:enterochelin esterase-like enzyme